MTAGIFDRAHRLPTAGLLVAGVSGAPLTAGAPGWATASQLREARSRTSPPRHCASALVGTLPAPRAGAEDASPATAADAREPATTLAGP